MLILYPETGAAAQPGQPGDAKPADKQSVPAPRIAEALQLMLISQNMCISYAYDQNGNRLNQTSSGIPASAPMWGSTTYPCFVWSAN